MVEGILLQPLVFRAILALPLKVALLSFFFFDDFLKYAKRYAYSMKLRDYIVRRFLLAIPVFFGITIIVFTLTRSIGDPASIYITPDMTRQQVEWVREYYHFNDPIYVQYVYWFIGLLKGDLGHSEVLNLPVSKAIITLLPASLELAIYSFILSLIVGVILGTISAVKKDTWVDHVTRFVALSGFSLPLFWFALILLYLFYSVLGLVTPGRLSLDVILRYLPPYGDFKYYTGLMTIDSILNGNIVVFMDTLKHLALPVVVQTYTRQAVFTRILRSSMLEELSKEYVLLGHAKGLDEKTVISRYARRNALIPFVTVAGMQFVAIMSGVVLTESVFNWPGLGRLAATAAMSLDHATILGFALFMGILFIASNLVVDILYSYLDPRILMD
jgi:ABC-type dipeptide/oligopeptide/nickel transport system permease component